MMTENKISYRHALEEAQATLMEQNILDARLDAWYLLESVIGWTRTKYMLRCDEEMKIENYLQYQELVQKRKEHIPLQHITGYQEFMGLPFSVNKDVLIPRQDTEVLVEEVQKVCHGKSVLDMCTGSGCIIISLKKYCDSINAVGVDISKAALMVARENMKKNKVDVLFLESNMFEEIENSYDIIVSNPPYIKTEDIPFLMPEVRKFEPWIALDGDEDGLAFYRILAREGKKHLKEDGYLFLEIGMNQGEMVKKLLNENDFNHVMIKKDYAGLDRVVIARRKKNV